MMRKTRASKRKLAGISLPEKSTPRKKNTTLYGTCAAITENASLIKIINQLL